MIPPSEEFINWVKKNRNKHHVGSKDWITWDRIYCYAQGAEIKERNYKEAGLDLKQKPTFDCHAKMILAEALHFRDQHEVGTEARTYWQAIIDSLRMVINADDKTESVGTFQVRGGIIKTSLPDGHYHIYARPKKTH